NKNYDKYNCIPNWAKKSLENHMVDKREYIYDLKTLEKGLTHDDYWNTAQKEMVITGKMHGYMRMYWGKKIIEWANNPEEAFRVMTYLNNKYNIDGRDANSYAGIAWCFGKHDRPWKERQIFGMIRYMNQEGLDRKFKMDEYKKIVDNLKL
ncbi:MAG: deoxyribodipyrimidine photolyase, partial [Tenericutes bacterium]|nr:deoxyribodipyrimidine photolyase [Mycoplasmatota bacterium]